MTASTTITTTRPAPKVGTVRWLSANGLPGFGREVARLAGQRVTVLGVTPHVAVFGGVELARARHLFEQRTGRRAGC